MRQVHQADPDAQAMGVDSARGNPMGWVRGCSGHLADPGAEQQGWIQAGWILWGR